MKGSKRPKYKVLAMYTDWIRKNRTYGAIGWYRIVNPMRKLGAKVVGRFTMGTIQSALQLKEWGDVWFMRPSDATNISLLIETAKEFTGAKLVIDMDDDLRHINEDHLMKEELERKAPEIIRQLKFADHVVVSTEPLKESFKDLNDRITVIHNSIDPKIWDVKRKKRNDGKIRIGWTASASHYSDIPLIEPPIKEILEKYPNVEFHMMGMIPENLQNDRTFHHEATNGYKEFPQHLANFDFDIAVAPLFDNQFNRCKSNIKWLEFSMLEIPMVLSKVYPYEYSIEHGKTGYLAENKNQWVKYLSWLIESEELRRKIGQAAKEEVLKNWTIDKFLPKYQKLIDNLMQKRDITVITSITGGKNELLPAPKSDRAQYLCFTDQDIHSEDWKVLKACDKFKNPVLNAKIHKILAHKYCDTDYIIWVDGNIQLLVDPAELIEQLGDKDLALFNHPGRDDIYDEADACVALKKGDLLEIAEQIKEYAKREYPRHTGLCECGVIVRRNNEKTNALFEKWWAEITRYSERDQLSFPMVIKREDISLIKGKNPDSDSIYRNNGFVKLTNHKK